MKPHPRLRPLILAASFALASLPLSVVGTSPAQAATTYKASLVQAVKSLPVANEVTSGYNRDAFRHWTDANGDCQDARQEVLISESKVAVTGSCTVVKGKWVSYYDGVTTTDPSTFDIDHMVALGEAYGSGAATWDAATREAYANDLGDKRSLVAVTAASNRSKSDRDPAEWLPKKNVCRYVAEWTAVKIRWSLTADAVEKRKLLSLANNCPATTLTVVKAKVVREGTSTPPSGGATGLRVNSISYDPAGTDTLNGEYVVLTNTTSESLTVTGWKLVDEAGSAYTFPKFALPAKGQVTLYTGSGTNSATKLYAGRGTAWWNNSGDAFKLYNAAGALKQSGSYTGAGDGSTATF